MKFQVITTMNARGWQEHGQRMVESFLQQWPDEAKPLIIYAEDFDPPEMPGIEVRRLPEWLTEFKARWGKTPAYNGHRNGGYDYRFDCVKFSHKVGAMTDAMPQIEDGIACWLDADTFTHAPVTVEWLLGLFPEPAYIAWLDRRHAHPESGFMMFRAAHQYHRNFFESLQNLYTSGEIFKLRETHDALAMQHLVMTKAMARKIPPPVSLSGAGFRTSHPAINGPLGACLDHMKGPRKGEGRSRDIDLIAPRSELYWQKRAR